MVEKQFTKRKKQKRVGILIALGIMILFIATFLLKCTAVSPWVYGTEERKKIIVEEMEKRYGKEFEITKCDWGGTLLGPSADMIGVKLKNSTDKQRYGIFGYIIDGKYTVHDNYFAEAVIKDDYEAVISKILDKELGEYKIQRIDFKGYNNYVDYCTKDTKLGELYDLGMKYGPRDEDGVTLFRPDVEIDIPESLNSNRDMETEIKAILGQFAQRRLVIFFSFNVVKDEAYQERGTEAKPYLRDDLVGYYYSRVTYELNISIDNYDKY